MGIDDYRPTINELFNTRLAISENTNPEYVRLALLAYDTVLQTMIEGEKEHNVDGWKNVNIPAHGMHVIDHIYYHSRDDVSEDHIAHALTRLAMIKYLEKG
jgi:hypothetical protein